MPVRGTALWMLVALGLSAGHEAQGTTLIVTKKATKLRTQKRLFAPAVCDLKEGDRVLLNGSEGAWRNVTYTTNHGWIHESDVTTKTDVRLSGQGVRENYSASEQAAARKGFNPDVERESATSIRTSGLRSRRWTRSRRARWTSGRSSASCSTDRFPEEKP